VLQFGKEGGSLLSFKVRGKNGYSYMCWIRGNYRPGDRALVRRVACVGFNVGSLIMSII